MGRRLGVMGGTFDPIHYGHLVTAEEALVQFALDAVMFVPTGHPWMKQGRVVSPAEDRYLMTVIATASNPRFQVSRVEIDRDGPTYAVDTLRTLSADNPDAELYFITGADAMLEILDWKDPEEVLSIAHFIAATRPGYDLARFEEAGPGARRERQHDDDPGARDQLDRHPRTHPRRPSDPVPGPRGREELRREGGAVPVTRRLALLVLVAVLATAGTGALLIARERARTEPEVAPPAAAGLALLVVTTDGGPLPVVVGSTGFGTSGALVVPPDALVVVPGQGESTIGDALGLPPRQAATAVGNLLGVWIEDHAMIEADRLAAIADDVGGVRIGGELADGRDVSGMFEASGAGDVAGLQIVMEALLAADVAWSPADLAEAAHPGAWSGCSRRRPVRRWPRSRPRRWRAGCSERPPNRSRRRWSRRSAGRSRRPCRSSC